ncbi:hypothetical protein [uncultured Roseibium sp.]|uniref:hypothetical protein n=1 Tax=uncultured Roseibium sp. TaxID=1936171 RepID=UPI0032170A07
MADYYSILKKTIGSLPENNGAARRGVYSRARNAIVNQLKAYEPPLSPSEITAEQLRLEEAIRKVEAEAARESLGLTPLSKPPAAAGTSGTATLTARQEPTPPPAPPEEKAPAVQPETPAPASPLKQAVEDAEKLGAASHMAIQSTKEAISSPAETGVGSSQEPVMAAYEPEAETDDYKKEPHQDYGSNGSNGYEVRHHAYADDMDDEAETGGKGRGRKRLSDAVRRPGRGLSLVPLALIGVLILIVLGIAGVIYSQRDMISEMMAGGSSSPKQTVTDGETTAPVTTEPRVAVDTAGADKNGGKITDRLLDDNGQPAAAPDARTVTTTTITPDQSSTQAATPAAPAETVAPAASVPQTETATPAPATPEPAVPEPATPEVAAPVSTPSVPQIVASTEEGEKQGTSPAPEGTAAVAQRAILYEEGAGENGAGTASQGEVVWALKEETDLDGKKQEVLTAEVRIPERHVSVDLRLKPNDDSSLPASHLVEIKYNFPKEFPAGDVQNVPGLVMKPTEQARGDALIGASVKVSEGYFWIALSNISSERERNIGLLRERGWIDIPMLYDNGKRGILTLEKGPTGTKAVDEAVQAWQAG